MRSPQTHLRLRIGTLLMALLATPVLAERQTVSMWEASDLGDWKQKSFEGQTRYSATEGILSARAQSAASALYRDKKIDLRKMPVLNWSWKANSMNGASNPLRKGEDDFPARIYVVYREGLFPWQTLAINYVWAQSDLKREAWPNPFTAKAMMVPVVSGKDKMGEWQHHRVNVREDFKRYFDKDVDHLDGVALMTDADNYGGVSAAEYGEIWFSTE